MKICSTVLAGTAMILLLAACAGGLDQLPDPQPELPNTEESETSPDNAEHTVTFEYVGGPVGIPEPYIAIACIDGSAFLYLWEDGHYKGGPAVTRFPEQDESCQPNTEQDD
jgi:hypothetical protein